MIPFRMLNGRPGKGLHMSGLAPDVSAGHQEMNYARLQAHRRLEELSGVLRKLNVEKLQTHFALRRPTLIHRRGMPQISA